MPRIPYEVNEVVGVYTYGSPRIHARIKETSKLRFYEGELCRVIVAVSSTNTYHFIHIIADDSDDFWSISDIRRIYNHAP